MKVIMISVFIILVGSSVAMATAAETNEENSAIPKWNDDPKPAQAEHEEGLLKEKESNELQDNLDIADGKTGELSDNSQSQGIHLKLNHKGGTTITFTPDRVGSGTTYTRWGKRSCPKGATKVYDGYAAGGWYNQKGNGANYLCMHKQAQYLSTTKLHAPSQLYGAEYETSGGLLHRLHDYNVPCVVCQSRRINKLVVPGRVSCPRSWTREYYGYLMTSHYNHWQTLVYECVDHYPDVIPGTKSNRNGALFYFTTAVCTYGLPCGPYVNNRAITCAVCTK